MRHDVAVTMFVNHVISVTARPVGSHIPRSGHAAASWFPLDVRSSCHVQAANASWHWLTGVWCAALGACEDGIRNDQDEQDGAGHGPVVRQAAGLIRDSCWFFHARMLARGGPMGNPRVRGIA